MDSIATLGELAFASRLRRLGERLSRDVSLLYHKLDIDFNARWFTLFYNLLRHSPMTITALADVIGMSHTAVKQIAGEMGRRGLVSSSKGKVDRRQQLLFLTRKGRETAGKLQPVWDEIRKATKEVIDKTGCDVLAGIGAVERCLDEQNMYERVWIRLKGSPPGDLEIREYGASMKKYFQSLNYEWLRDYFTIEKQDERILSDPKGTIIKNGGAIFFACVDGDVVGTCALRRHSNDTLELLKMAVTMKFRGRGIGRKLLETVVDRAGEMGAEVLYLQTSPALKAANHLYKEAGFRRTKSFPPGFAGYRRPTVVMKLDLIKK